MSETYRAKRQRQALTAAAERRLLQSMGERLPAWVTSDHLTVLGVLGAIGAAAGYVLSHADPRWLWLASAMLVVNWFGDSLDGTVARVRKTERPRYGYYLDHAVDGLTTAMIGAGIGFSPFADLRVALLLVILYLLMSINVYLESSVWGVFRMDYGITGPTEVRIILILLNTLLVWLVVGTAVPLAALSHYGTVAIGAAAAGMLLLFLYRFFQNLRRLAGQEPLPRPGEGEKGEELDGGEAGE